MPKYEKIFDSISYLENERHAICSWVGPEKQEKEFFAHGYPHYDRKFTSFIDEIYHSDLLNGDYFSILNEKVQDKNFKAAIPTADLELLTAILTYYVRQERFCDGAWEEAINEKVFVSILKRLRELV